MDKINYYPITTEQDLVKFNANPTRDDMISDNIQNGLPANYYNSRKNKEIPKFKQVFTKVSTEGSGGKRRKRTTQRRRKRKGGKSKRRRRM
jgi:hypothetical protein